MPKYTYTVLHGRCELAYAEADDFTTARTTALAELPDDHYPLAELTYKATAIINGTRHTLRGKCF